MITLTRREDCCGCSACQQVCPQRCIDLKTDKEGYWYPYIDVTRCVDCNLCEKACPIRHQDEERIPLKVYAAINKDESVRAKSASGGIFTIIAEEVLKKGGVVFGVKFDKDWNVVFGYTETIDGLEAFRRSKYVQAWTGDAFKEVKEFLNKGRLVLFTGTPCHIAGLRHYLRKEYDNLLLMDLICEGVPSPKVWKKYLNEEIALLREKNSVLPHPISKKDVFVEDISFRNKKLGWKKYSFALTLSTTDGSGKKYSFAQYVNRDSAYMQAMFRYLDLRPVCYECPFKSCKSGSDITVADYWGINKLHPEMDDDKGTSMVYLNTVRGITYFPMEKVNFLETDYKEAFLFNNVVSSAKKHKNRDLFYRDLDKYDSIIKLLNRYTYTNKEKIKMTVRKSLTTKQYEFLKSVWHKLKK